MTRRCAPMGIEAASAVARRGASRAGQLLSVPVGPRDYERGRRDASADGVDASFGPSAVLRSVWTSHGEADASPPLAHTRRSRAHTLAASATTIHGKGNFAGTGPRPDCSVIPGTPSPEQSGQIPGGFHERMRETTPPPTNPRQRSFCRLSSRPSSGVHAVLTESPVDHHIYRLLSTLASRATRAQRPPRDQRTASAGSGRTG